METLEDRETTAHSIQGSHQTGSFYSKGHDKGLTVELFSILLYLQQSPSLFSKFNIQEFLKYFRIIHF